MNAKREPSGNAVVVNAKINGEAMNTDVVMREQDTCISE
jgi:hypothetical protein